ncbi:MAG: SDR family NAD(P)-dependent oxidoreductase, partial [Gemmatimonadales bacterium]
VARRGGQLVLAARSVERLRAAAAGLEPSPIIVPCDVADPAAVRGLVAAARRQLGGIDVLINNAGRSVYGELERTPLREVHDLLAVNFLGPLHLMLEVLPEMRRRREGLIVNVASVAALHGVPYLAAYAASKAALAVAGQSLRAELATVGVGVLTVYPGYTRTPLFACETRVGGARRPRRGYAAADRVAAAIVRAIERDRRELVLSLEGQLLAALRRLAPRVIDAGMTRIAAALRVPDGACHG